MTKREMYAELKALAVAAGKDELVAGIDHEVELLNKKNSAERKPTAAQLVNAELKDFLAQNLPAGEGLTVTEIIKQVLAGTKFESIASVSKVSAVLTQMLNAAEPVVSQHNDKRKSLYAHI